MDEEILTVSTDSSVSIDFNESTDSSEISDLDDDTHTTVDITPIVDELKTANENINFLITTQIVSCSLILSILIFLALIVNVILFVFLLTF